MLLNYVVRIKKLKVNGLNRFLKYLNNDKHKNHTKKNTEIYELSNQERFTKISKNKITKNKMGYIKNRKGGRPLSVLGKSLTFNIPVGFDFDLEVSKLIYEDIVNGLKEIYKNLPPNKLGDPYTSYDLEEEEIYSVLHKQNNSHYHIVVPYLDRNGNVMRGVKSNEFTNNLKLLWNEIMIKHYEIDLEQYQPQTKEELEKGKNRRYLEELKELYVERLKIKEEKYVINQLKRVNRELKRNDSELESEENESTMETIEKNYKKTTSFFKSIPSTLKR